MVWLEVETKVDLTDSQVKDLRKRIQKIAKFKKKGKKVDDYFAMMKGNRYPKKAFRFRTLKDGVEVTFKRHINKYYTDYVVVKKEFEFTLNKKENRKSLRELFEDFGFEEWVRKEKKNETYSYKKDSIASIELNHVKYLGWFMEIEYLCQEKDVKKGINTIMKILDELNIDLKQVDNVGYTKRLWQKHRLGSQKFIDKKK